MRARVGALLRKARRALGQYVVRLHDAGYRVHRRDLAVLPREEDYDGGGEAAAAAAYRAMEENAYDDDGDGPRIGRPVRRSPPRFPAARTPGTS